MASYTGCQCAVAAGGCCRGAAHPLSSVVALVSRFSLTLQAAASRQQRRSPGAAVIAVTSGTAQLATSAHGFRSLAPVSCNGRPLRTAVLHRLSFLYPEPHWRLGCQCLQLPPLSPWQCQSAAGSGGAGWAGTPVRGQSGSQQSSLAGCRRPWGSVFFSHSRCKPLHGHRAQTPQAGVSKWGH